MTIETLSKRVATFLNIHDVPSSYFAQLVDMLRIQEAEKNGDSRSRTAASMGISKRRVLQLIKEGIDETEMPAGRAFEDIFIEFLSVTDELSFTELVERLQDEGLVLDEEQVRAIVHRGVQQGYFERRGKGDDAVISWTRERYVYPSPGTDDERATQAERAMTVAVAADPENVHEVVGNVTAAGLERLVQFLDPARKDAQSYSLLKNRADESRSRAKRNTRASENFGFLHLLDQPEDGSLVNSVHHFRDGLKVLLPSTEYLDSQAQSAVFKTDLSECVAQAEMVMQEAEAMGAGERIAVRLRIAAAVCNPHPGKPLAQQFAKVLSAAALCMMFLVGTLVLGLGKSQPSSSENRSGDDSALVEGISNEGSQWMKEFADSEKDEESGVATTRGGSGHGLVRISRDGHGLASVGEGGHGLARISRDGHGLTSIGEGGHGLA